jgi:hypothetical protein
VTNSVLQTLFFHLLSANESRLAIKRRVLANPMPGCSGNPLHPTHATLFSNPTRSPRTALAVRMKGTFVRSPVELIYIINCLTWQGSGNVYAVPQGYAYGKWLPSLAAWRAQVQSEADSFEDLPPQLDPAQWHVRPDSPGYAKRPDGRDFGADVSRVAATAPRRR